MPDVSSNDSGARLPATPHEWKALYLGTFPAPDLKDLLRRIGVGLPQADGLAMRREAFRQTQALEAQLDEAQEANRMLTARCDELEAERDAIQADIDRIKLYLCTYPNMTDAEAAIAAGHVAHVLFVEQGVRRDNHPAHRSDEDCRVPLRDGSEVNIWTDEEATALDRMQGEKEASDA